MIEREWQERTLGPEEKRRKVLRTRGKMTETGQEGKSGESRKEASPRAERGLAQDPRSSQSFASNANLGSTNKASLLLFQV